ncbi:Hypothetical predicted protein, partial [Podarcis lilfordi]
MRVGVVFYSALIHTPALPIPALPSPPPPCLLYEEQQQRRQNEPRLWGGRPGELQQEGAALLPLLSLARTPRRACRFPPRSTPSIVGATLPPPPSLTAARVYTAAAAASASSNNRAHRHSLFPPAPAARWEFILLKQFLPALR